MLPNTSTQNTGDTVAEPFWLAPPPNDAFAHPFSGFDAASGQFGAHLTKQNICSIIDA